MLAFIASGLLAALLSAGVASQEKQSGKASVAKKCMQPEA
jgi:hypothetical protein